MMGFTLMLRDGRLHLIFLILMCAAKSSRMWLGSVPFALLKVEIFVLNCLPLFLFIIGLSFFGLRW
jgi:hypothetical protein